MPEKISRYSFILKSSLTGALLGFGAPIGYFLFSFAFMNTRNLQFIDWCQRLLSQEPLLIFYLTVPTVVIFTCFGLYHGIQETRLDFKTKQMDQLLHVVAHDIGSPLAVFKEGANLLKDEVLGPVTKDQKEMCEMMDSQVVVIHDLTRELLDISKMESGAYVLELQTTDIASLVHKSVYEMNLLIKKKRGTTEIEAKLPQKTMVRVDQFRLRQVLRNIIRNAVRYIPEQGRIIIGVAKSINGDIEIAVSNNGEPIPDDKINTIFNKFAQAKQRDQKLGYGLGLAICKNIVDLHKGRIWAENNSNGVSFHICLPRQLVVS